MGLYESQEKILACSSYFDNADFGKFDCLDPRKCFGAIYLPIVIGNLSVCVGDISVLS